MIKALINDKVTLTVEPGSIVIVSEGQFQALGGIAVAYKKEAKEVEEIKEEPAKEPVKKASTSKKTSKGRKSED